MQTQTQNLKSVLSRHHINDIWTTFRGIWDYFMYKIWLINSVVKFEVNCQWLLEIIINGFFAIRVTEPNLIVIWCSMKMWCPSVVFIWFYFSRNYMRNVCGWEGCYNQHHQRIRRNFPHRPIAVTQHSTKYKTKFFKKMWPDTSSASMTFPISVNNARLFL